MFDVVACFELGQDWEAKDRVCEKAARAKAHHGCTENTAGKPGLRKLVWRVKTFEDAQALKKRLELVKAVHVTMHETQSV